MMIEAYKPRLIRFLELWQAEGWQMKVYGITYEGKSIDEALVQAAKQTALEVLPQPARNLNRYGLGFIGIHQGRSYDFVTVAYWNYSTELKQLSLMRASSRGTTLESVDEQELSSDVWDLYLLAFERQAWVSHMLQSSQASPEGYLSTQLNELI
ncbi:MAG: hypothetical protein R2880_03145 [Deinococcales bacterium]